MITDWNQKKQVKGKVGNNVRVETKELDKTSGFKVLHEDGTKYKLDIVAVQNIYMLEEGSRESKNF